MSRAIIDSPVGPLVITATAVGVRGVAWVGHRTVDDVDASGAADAVLDRALGELSEYFVGARRSFDVPVDRRDRRGFRGEVLDARGRLLD